MKADFISAVDLTMHPAFLCLTNFISTFAAALFCFVTVRDRLRESLSRLSSKSFMAVAVHCVLDNAYGEAYHYLPQDANKLERILCENFAANAVEQYYAALGI